MRFLQRELDRIQRALRQPQIADRYRDLYAAQQALAWALEPDAFRSPYDFAVSAPIEPATGIPEDLGDCSALFRQLQS